MEQEKDKIEETRECEKERYRVMKKEETKNGGEYI